MVGSVPSRKSRKQGLDDEQPVRIERHLPTDEIHRSCNLHQVSFSPRPLAYNSLPRLMWEIVVVKINDAVWCVNRLAEYPFRLTNFPVRTNSYASPSQHLLDPVSESTGIQWLSVTFPMFPYYFQTSPQDSWGQHTIRLKYLACSRCEFPLGIAKPAIRRLACRGGVKGISGLIYEETRMTSSKSSLRMSSGTSSRIPSTRNGV